MNSLASRVVAALLFLQLGACDDSAERAKLEAARRQAQATIAKAELEAASPVRTAEVPVKAKAKAKAETEAK